MSEDLDVKDPSGGHVLMPRRIPLWPFAAVLVSIVGLSFAFGGWAWAIETRVAKHEDLIPRVIAYMCMDCVTRKGQDSCSDICGSEGP